MNKKFISAAIFGILFVALIVLLCTFDVAPIGPANTQQYIRIPFHCLGRYLRDPRMCPDDKEKEPFEGG